MKKQINQLRAGVLLSYVNLALSSLIPMFYTPVMLRVLGQAEHGLYSLASSTVNYLSLLNFGFGSTIVRYLAKYRAQDDRESVRRTYGFFLTLYSILGILVIISGILLAVIAPSLFDFSLTESEISTIKTLILLLTVQMALAFPFSVFTSVILSNERYLYRRIVDIITTLITPIFNLIALHLGFASIGLAVNSIIFQIIMVFPNIIYSVRILKLIPSFKRLPKELVFEMIGFSGYVFLSNIVEMMFWATDKVILGVRVGSAAVSIYQIGGAFNTMVMQFSASFSNVLSPRVTGLVVKDTPVKQLSELFIKIGRIQFFVIALIVSGFIAFGQAFIDLWVGPDYRDSYWITILTILPLCIPLIQNTGYQILMAQNKHRFRAVTYFIIAILNVISTWLIVPYLGGIGAALCSFFSYLIGHGVAINLYYYHIIHLDIPEFWRQIGGISVVPIGIMALSLFLQRLFVPEDWFSFFTCVIVYVCVYFICVYYFCMNQYERTIIKNPIEKVLKLMRRR